MAEFSSKKNALKRGLNQTNFSLLLVPADGWVDGATQKWCRKGHMTRLGMATCETTKRTKTQSDNIILLRTALEVVDGTTKMNRCRIRLSSVRLVSLLHICVCVHVCVCVCVYKMNVQGLPWNGETRCMAQAHIAPLPKPLYNTAVLCCAAHCQSQKCKQ